MRRKKMTTKIHDEKVNEWLNSQKPETKTNYKGIWKKFAEFTQMTGTEILASREKDKDYFWEKRVLEFKTWLLAKGFADYTATTAVMGIRGFFAFHRVPLQYRRTESKKLGERSRKTEDYRLSLEDLKKCFEVANLQERYIVTAGKSFGLRAGDFLRLSRGDLEPYIEREPPISIGELRTQKEKVLAYPFIDTDAQPIVKLMLEKMDREGRTAPEEKMLSYADEIQLSRTLKRLTQKAGLNTGNKQVRFHILRKFLIDHLSSVMSESKWKQIVGKQISEAAYVSADSLREDYARAMPETTFTKRATEDVQKIAKLESLKLFAKSAGYSAEEIARIRMRKPNVSPDEEIEEIEKMLAEKNQVEEACDDGKHCETQRVVTEAELSKFLGEGWRVVTALQSGSVVIQRQSC
jgi:hypothetical protein